MVELVYTDGACSKNGAPDATGGFGIFIARSDVFGGAYRINRKGEGAQLDGQIFYVTNIRMEGLAILATLQLYTATLNPNTDCSDALRVLNTAIDFDSNVMPMLGEVVSPRVRAVEIVTDSLFWMNVINKWMPGWIAKGIMMDKKNPDLLIMLHNYTELLKKSGVVVTYTHVKSHQRGQRTAHADGNDVADVLATTAVNNATNEFHLA